jgi:O-antigen ligase
VNIQWSSFFTILMVVFFSIGVSVDRVFGIPTPYLALYVPSIIYALRNNRVLLSPVVKRLLIFFAVYFLYSMVVTKDIYSTIQYFGMWLANILVVHHFLNVRNYQKISLIYANIVFSCLAIGFVLYQLNVFNSANPINAFNKNSFIFLIISSFFILLLYKKNNLAILLLFFSIFVFSRTLYMMYIAGGLTLLLLTKKINLNSLIMPLLIIFIIFSYSDVIQDRVKDALFLIEALFAYISEGGVNYSLNIYDSQRYYVLISNIELMLDIFPYGTGMGLDNYLKHIDPSFSEYLHSGKMHRAHNFYVSYMAEMGIIFFIIFIHMLFRVFFYNFNIYYLSAFSAMLVGILTNEYVTSPYFWMMYALIYREKYDKAYV